MSTVDVIVPCYRYGHYLKECVESVLTQSGPGVRVLIIDDFSPDNTTEVAAELARDDSRVTVFRHTSNQGHIATYNEGIGWASADYLLLLSADDYLLPGALNRAVALMDNQPEVGFVFGNAIELNEVGQQRLTNDFKCGNDTWIFTGPEFVRRSSAGNIVTTATAVVRTRLQKQVGGYRVELPHSGDMEMWLRLAAFASVGYVEAPQAVYRRHNTNMSLGYMAEGFLHDMEQRKAALDYFFLSCGNLLPDGNRLRRDAYWSMGRAMLGLASLSFDRGNMNASEQLRELAVVACPRVRRSMSWVKLGCRRALGYDTWLSLAPVVNCVRRLGLPL